MRQGEQRREMKVKRLSAGSYEVPDTPYFFYHRYEMEPTDANGESTRGDWYVYEQEYLDEYGLRSDRLIDIVGSYKQAKNLVFNEYVMDYMHRETQGERNGS
tara:strand:- start:457 stop:762 length:306 start_codon:yes stop_codon:yes gene_type:complete